MPLDLFYSLIDQKTRVEENIPSARHSGFQYCDSEHQTGFAR
jgi:hypothetical protein